MDSAEKYMGTPDCSICQNGDGNGNCGMNPMFNRKNVKKFDICLRFFRKQDGINTHIKYPGCFYHDGERCPEQFIGKDIEWKCKKIGKDCDHVCTEQECEINPLSTKENKKEIEIEWEE